MATDATANELAHKLRVSSETVHGMAREKKRFREIVFSNRYAKHIESRLSRGSIPRPPATASEMCVIVDEHPQLLAEYLPLLITDTPCRRAAKELVDDVGDWWEGSEVASC